MAAAKELSAAKRLSAQLKRYWNSEVGPKTTHFWGPIANWGFVAAGLADLNKPPELMSGNMTAAMCVYSALFMRFSLAIRPKNYLLFGCHASNEAVQLYHLSRIYKYHSSQKDETAESVPA